MPLSLLLFYSLLEVLTNTIRQNKLTKGLRMVRKVKLYLTDDMIVYLGNLRIIKLTQTKIIQ